MKTIKTKLQDSHGVSILFALLLMAVAAMISITIISASLSAVKRSHAIKNTRQELLSLDSATLYIEKQLNTDTGAFEVSFSQNADGTYSVTNTNQYGGAFKEEVNALTNAFLTGNRGNEIGTFSLKQKIQPITYLMILFLYHIRLFHKIMSSVQLLYLHYATMTVSST